MKNIYSTKMEFSVYYTYDNRQQKVYDFETIKEDFKQWIKHLKSQ